MMENFESLDDNGQMQALMAELQDPGLRQSVIDFIKQKSKGKDSLIMLSRSGDTCGESGGSGSGNGSGSSCYPVSGGSGSGGSGSRSIPSGDSGGASGDSQSGSQASSSDDRRVEPSSSGHAKSSDRNRKASSQNSGSTGTRTGGVSSGSSNGALTRGSPNGSQANSSDARIRKVTREYQRAQEEISAEPDSGNGSAAAEDAGNTSATVNGPTELQTDHRERQIELVKSRPEYKDIAALLPTGTSTDTPRPDVAMSNRKFECERQVWHRSLHICAGHIRGHIVLGGPTKFDNNGDNREVLARQRSIKLMHMIYEMQKEPFPKCHTLVESISDDIEEAWARPRGARMAVSVGDPAQQGVLVHCCHRFPVFAGRPLAEMLNKNCKVLQEGAMPPPTAETKKGMREVVAGKRQQFTCILANIRGGNEEFRNLLHLKNIWLPGHDGKERRFVFGVQIDITGLFLYSKDIPELEQIVVQATQTGLSIWNGELAKALPTKFAWQ